MQILVSSFRREKGWMLRELSQRSGVSASHISDLENGNKKASIEVICKLAKTFKVKPEELFKCD